MKPHPIRTSKINKLHDVSDRLDELWTNYLQNPTAKVEWDAFCKHKPDLWELFIENTVKEVANHILKTNPTASATKTLNDELIDLYNTVFQ
jgi:hypothetical protein